MQSEYSIWNADYAFIDIWTALRDMTQPNELTIDLKFAEEGINIEFLLRYFYLRQFVDGTAMLDAYQYRVFNIST